MSTALLWENKRSILHDVWESNRKNIEPSRLDSSRAQAHSTGLGGLRFGAVAATVHCEATTDKADDPRSKAFEENQGFAVAGDDGFALAASNGAENLDDRFARGHHEPLGNWFFGFGMEGATIVDATDVGGDETWADEGDFDTLEGELGGNGVG